MAAEGSAGAAAGPVAINVVCQAAACGATLLVQVPPSHLHNLDLRVRCGECSKVLAVQLPARLRRWAPVLSPPEAAPVPAPVPVPAAAAWSPDAADGAHAGRPPAPAGHAAAAAAGWDTGQEQAWLRHHHQQQQQQQQHYHQHHLQRRLLLEQSCQPLLPPPPPRETADLGNLQALYPPRGGDPTSSAVALTAPESTGPEALDSAADAAGACGLRTSSGGRQQAELQMTYQDVLKEANRTAGAPESPCRNPFRLQALADAAIAGLAESAATAAGFRARQQSLPADKPHWQQNLQQHSAGWQAHPGAAAEHAAASPGLIRSAPTALDALLQPSAKRARHQQQQQQPLQLRSSAAFRLPAGCWALHGRSAPPADGSEPAATAVVAAAAAANGSSLLAACRGGMQGQLQHGLALMPPALDGDAGKAAAMVAAAPAASSAHQSPSPQQLALMPPPPVRPQPAAPVATWAGAGEAALTQPPGPAAHNPPRQQALEAAAAGEAAGRLACHAWQALTNNNMQHQHQQLQQQQQQLENACHQQPGPAQQGQRSNSLAPGWQEESNACSHMPLRSSPSGPASGAGHPFQLRRSLSAAPGSLAGTPSPPLPLALLAAAAANTTPPPPLPSAVAVANQQQAAAQRKLSWQSSGEAAAWPHQGLLTPAPGGSRSASPGVFGCLDSMMSAPVEGAAADGAGAVLLRHNSAPITTELLQPSRPQPACAGAGGVARTASFGSVVTTHGPSLAAASAAEF